MPSLGLHYLVLDEFTIQLRRSETPGEQSLAADMDASPAFASLGAIGPDALYYHDSPAGLVAGVADVFSGINTVGTLLGQAATLAGNAGLPNIKQLVSSFADTVSLAIANLEVTIENAVVKVHDIIAGEYIMGGSKIQDNAAETTWKWGDIVHDRLSGVFAQSLMDRAVASGNAAWRAYATGYYTHLATDFTGHPYVNQVVGGPARGFLMRHTVAEKFMDARAFNARGSDINTSRLHRRTEPLLHTPELTQLCNMLSGALAALAPIAAARGYSLDAALSAEEIEDAIENMNSLFRLVTEQTFVPPPVFPSIAMPPLPGQYGSILNRLASGATGGRTPRTLSDWLKTLLALLVMMPALVADITRFIADIAAGVFGYPIEIALYLLQSALYSMYRSIRWFLVVMGIAFPLADEISSGIGRQFISCREGDPDGYPHQSPKVRSSKERFQASGRVLEFDATDLDFLSYPQTPGEHPVARSSPYPVGVPPDYFISGPQPDPAYIAKWRAATSPADIRQIPLASPIAGVLTAGFGSAIDVCFTCLRDPALVADINLDSDRGYGHRQWRCDGGIDTGSLVHERFA